MIPRHITLAALFTLLLASCGQQQTPDMASTPTSESTAGGGVTQGQTFTPPADASATVAQHGVSAQAIVNCSAWTYNGTAQAICTITTGQARVRADCSWAPDLYSPWTGRGTWSMWTGKCPFGIRSAIIETRY
ncbi:hypothetical protein Dxin01_00860 [Deinococcus xinjiangensis]|uniref:Uncharacterized protein n=1 Tax=Deinococcus xinjiangensis TaxID=457454 RepID=A0ABP9V777_9DEIO